MACNPPSIQTTALPSSASRRASSSETPSAAARLSLWKGTLLLSETETLAQVATQNAWMPVDTMASIIRHGEARMSFTFANPSRTPATVRLTLFDEMGEEQARWEQILPAFAQREWSLGDLFNVRKHRGTVRFWSDVPLALSARRVTRNMRGEPVENEIGYLDSSALVARTLEFPEISDGAGLATELILINPGQEAADAQLSFVNTSGEPKEIILR